MYYYTLLKKGMPFIAYSDNVFWANVYHACHIAFISCFTAHDRTTLDLFDYGNRITVVIFIKVIIFYQKSLIQTITLMQVNINGICKK